MRRATEASVIFDPKDTHFSISLAANFLLSSMRSVKALIHAGVRGETSEKESSFTDEVDRILDMVVKNLVC